MFNRWKTYPKRKPKSDGFYLCTIGLEGGEYVLRLWYSVVENSWTDARRMKMFDTYQVCCSATGRRVHTDPLCDRTDEVIAWKKLPRAKRLKKVRKK